MKKTEMMQLMMQINLAYPSTFQVNKEIVEYWYRFMFDVDYVKAQKNLDHHVKSSKFPPTISDIVRLEEQSPIDYEQQKLETRQKLNHLALLEAKNPLTPKQLAEIQRKVETGELQEKYKDDPYLGGW